MKKFACNNNSFSLVDKEIFAEYLEKKGLKATEINDYHSHFSATLSDGSIYKSWDIPRDDVDFIELVEKHYGDGYLLEYDDENYNLHTWTDYDGWDCYSYDRYELIPVVREDKLEACKDVSEILTYLESLSVPTKRKENN